MTYKFSSLKFLSSCLLILALNLGGGKTSFAQETSNEISDTTFQLILEIQAERNRVQTVDDYKEIQEYYSNLSRLIAEAERISEDNRNAECNGKKSSVLLLNSHLSQIVPQLESEKKTICVDPDPDGSEGRHCVSNASGMEIEKSLNEQLSQIERTCNGTDAGAQADE